MSIIKYRPIPDLTTEELCRFWKNVDQRGVDECWPWVGGARSNGGYGHIKLRGHIFVASRVAYLLYHLQDPAMIVCHKCDNPPCCNGAHLYDGTHSQNSRERDSKGRRRPVCGTASNLAKINDEIAYQIQLEIAAKYPDAEIAEKYAVSPATIANIRKGRQWNHVRAPGFVPHRRPGNGQKSCWPKFPLALRPGW